MKSKIFLSFLVTICILFGAVYFMSIRPQYKEYRRNIKNRVSLLTMFYKHFNDAEKLKNIRDAREMAKKQELLDAFDTEKWSAIADTPEESSTEKAEQASEKRESMRKEIHDAVQVELNVINKLYDTSDVIFITDSDGVVVAKNLDGTLDNLNLSDKLLVNTALKGRGDQDVIMLIGKPYRAVAVPLIKDNEVVGMYCSANIMDTEMVKESFLDEESDSRAPVYFAFLTQKKLYGSNLPTNLHKELEKYIKSNSELFENLRKDAHKMQDHIASLQDEKYYLTLATHPRLSDKKDVFYMGMASLDKTVAGVDSEFYTLLLITILLLVISLIISFSLEFYFFAPINRFVENMIEIINGNTEYRFDNEAEGTEGMLNQNANYMISVLLGEKTPDEITRSKK